MVESLLVYGRLDKQSHACVCVGVWRATGLVEAIDGPKLVHWPR